MVTSYRQNGLVFLVLENAYIRTTILPVIGGKMVELTRKQSGTQFLLQPAHAYRTSRLPYYGADYFQYDLSGFDDCFPTIGASACPTKNDYGRHTTVHFPDHGELWGIPWNYYISEESVHLTVKGVRLNYEFSKTIRLEQETLHIDYRLINLSDSPFAYIWSAQPLLKAQPGSRILFDDSVDTVLLDWTTEAEIGKPGDRLPWPWLSPSRDTNYAIIPSPESTYAMKFYTDALVTEYCGYMRSDTGEKLIIEFDPQKVPYVGILLWYNGWSNNSGQARSTIALQPSRGRPDSLQQAYDRNEHMELDAFGMDEWSLRISLE